MTATSIIEREAASAVQLEPQTNSASHPEPKKRPSSLWRYLVGSTALWILFCLAGIDFFIATVRPLRYVHIQGVILRDQDPIADDVEALVSHPNDPHILLCGTSLTHCAASLADAVNENISFTQYSWDRYFKANAFDSLLKSKFGLRAKSLVACAGGGFFYDYWLLLKIAIDAGRRPPLVFLMVAPKDFMDTTRSLDDSHVRHSLNLRGRDTNEFDNFLSKLWTYYRMKADYRTVSEVVSCSLFNRAPTLFATLQTTDGPKPQQPTVTFNLQDANIDPMGALPEDEIPTYVQYYKNAYSSVKPERLNEQFDYLNKAISLCKQHGILCVVINMPLSKFNTGLLPKDFAPFYENKLQQVCQENHIQFIDLMRDNQFAADDFRDYVHLNGTGAIKFWHIVCDRLAPNAKALRASFK